MAQWAYFADQEGDLINLYKMEFIGVSEIDDSGEEGVTHQVLAFPSNPTTGAYPLYSGTKEACEALMKKLRGYLTIHL